MAVETSELDTTPRSRLDELRAAFAQELDEPRLFKRLPTRRKLPVGLVAEYRLLKAQEASDSLEALDLSGAQSILASALVCIHAHDPDDPAADARGLVPLHQWVGQPDLGPLGLDKRLTDLLGIPAGTASTILLSLFDGNEIALTIQAGQLGEWSADTTDETLQDFTPGS